MTPTDHPNNRNAPAVEERIMLRQYIHWRRLIGGTVQIRQHGHIIRTGTVDDAMADSTALWIAGDTTQPRTMYEAARGIEVWTEPEEDGNGIYPSQQRNQAAACPVHLLRSGRHTD